MVVKRAVIILRNGTESVVALFMTSTRGQNVQLVVSSIVSSRSEFVVSFILSLVVSSSCRLSNSSRLSVLLIGYFHLRSFCHVMCLFVTSCVSSSRRVSLCRVVCLFVASCVASSKRKGLGTMNSRAFPRWREHSGKNPRWPR